MRVASFLERALRAAALCAAMAAPVALWLGGGQPALATQFYVSTTGSNSNAGSSTAPWGTLQYAASHVGAGDRVVVRPGDYQGFHLTANGTSTNPIEFFAEPGVRIVDENPTTPDGINLEGASHVVIDGFAVTGMERAGVRSVGDEDDFAEFVTVRNVHAYDNGVWGIFTGFVDNLLIENNETSGSLIEHGIYVSNSGDWPVLRGNRSWGNHGSGIHMNGDESQGGDGVISNALVAGNIIFDNARLVGAEHGGGSGINMDGVQNSRIENNLLFGNHASGISLYRIDGAEGSSGNVVINNTVQQPVAIGQPPVASRWAINIRDGSTNNTVRNNILLNEGTYRGAISVWDDSLPGFASDYNVVISRFTTDDGDSVQTLAQWQAVTGNDLHSHVATAASLFVNPAIGDYRLKPGAVAVNAGAATLAPSVDSFGVPRPQGGGFDAGAIETPALAGDFNGSGAVTAADLVLWRNAFARRGWTGADFLLWQRQLGASLPVLPAAALVTTAIPEPATLALLMGVIAALRAPRRPWATVSRPLARA